MTETIEQGRAGDALLRLFDVRRRRMVVTGATSGLGAAYLVDGGSLVRA